MPEENELAQLIDAPSSEMWAVVLPDGAVGVTSFMRVDPATGQVEVAGVLYGHRLRRTQASTEVSHLLMRRALDTPDYRHGPGGTRRNPAAHGTGRTSTSWASMIAWPETGSI